MCCRLSRPKQSQGFTLVELLLVLAIIGIISAIAIPHFMGQRRRSQVIGDAMANASVLRMAMETRRAETGLYGTPSQIYTWRADGSDPSGPALIPTFEPNGSSKMNYRVTINANGLAYVLTVTDPTRADVTAFETNQSGAVLARLD